jgi:hypothetical protein
VTNFTISPNLFFGECIRRSPHGDFWEQFAPYDVGFGLEFLPCRTKVEKALLDDYKCYVKPGQGGERERLTQASGEI